MQQYQQRTPQQALDQVKNYGNENFAAKTVADLRTANTSLNTDIKKLKQQRTDIDATAKAAIQKSLKGLKDRFGELTTAQKKTACESMADNATTKGANSQDFEIRNQGCAQLGATLSDQQIDQYATNKRIGRFTNANSIPAGTQQFTFGKGKISTQFLKEICGSQECQVMHEELAATDVSVSGRDISGAQKFSIMRADGTALSKRSTNTDSKVEITFDGACPKFCLVAPGDSTTFEEGDNICTKAEVQGKCVVTSNETSTYAVGDFSLRQFGYWFLGIVTTTVIIMI